VGDIDLLNRELHVSRTYTSGIGATATKSNEARTVDLTPQAAALFESWLAKSGDKGSCSSTRTAASYDR